jgi:hypothetical protein
MDSTLNINQIVNEIEKLDYNGKIKILSKIAILLKREEKVLQKNTITRLKGLGKNIWKDTNPDTFIRQERESWD